MGQSNDSDGIGTSGRLREAAAQSNRIPEVEWGSCRGSELPVSGGVQALR